jgi:hypothetical protein
MCSPDVMTVPRVQSASFPLVTTVPTVRSPGLPPATTGKDPSVPLVARRHVDLGRLASALCS